MPTHRKVTSRVTSTRPVIRLLASATAALVTSTLAAAVGPAPAIAGVGCAPPPVAHRGDSARAPENTLPAFRRALRVGVRQLEVDVRFTLGDVPVAMHDETVDRTTDGRGRVADLTLEQVRSLDAGRWFASRYRGTRVPTLYEVLDHGRTRKAFYLVELKVRPTSAQMAAFLQRLDWLGMRSRVRVTSFDTATIADVRAAAPGLRTALIDRPRYRRPASVLRFGSTYLVHQYSLTDQRSKRWRRAGIALRPWTVNSPHAWRRMARGGAEAVITDRPKRYLAWARAYCR